MHHAISYLLASVNTVPSPWGGLSLLGNSSSVLKGYLECHILSEAFANLLMQGFASFYVHHDALGGF